MATLPQWIIRRKSDVGVLVDASERALSGFDEDGFESYEARALELAHEVVRQCLERQLQGRSSAFSDEVEVEGCRYRRHQPGLVGYHSLVGRLDVERATYREVGVRNGPTIVALDLQEGLRQRTTPALARSLVLGYADLPIRRLNELLRSAHLKPPSRSTQERVAKDLAQAFREELPAIEPVVRQMEKVPKDAVGVALGLDRTTVPMEEDRADSELKYEREKCKARLKERRHKVPVHVKYRMAWVGTVSLTDDKGEALITRTYSLAAHENPRKIIYRMVADVRRALRQRPDLVVGLIQDGAAELWNKMRPALRNEATIEEYHEVIDRYHLEQHVMACQKVVEPDAEKRQQQFRRWQRSLGRNKRALKLIYKALSKASWELPRKKLREALPHLSYIHLTSQRSTPYARCKELGLPMGSGATEGACKSVITMRTKRSGQRWRPKGIEAVLAVRSVRESDRFDACWSRSQRRAQHVVDNAA